MAGDIALSKLDNKLIKDFFEDAFGKKIPSSQVLRSRYTERMHREALALARARIGSDSIRVAMDETTDSSVRSISCLVASSMDNPKIGPYLFNIAEMKSTKNRDIMDFFERILEVLFDEGK